MEIKENTPYSYDYGHWTLFTLGLASIENDREENEIFFFFFLAEESLEAMKLKGGPYISAC